MSKGETAKADRRVPIKIDAVVYARLKDYSTITGVSITRTISEACEDWLETTGIVRIESLAPKERN